MIWGIVSNNNFVRGLVSMVASRTIHIYSWESSWEVKVEKVVLLSEKYMLESIKCDFQ